MKKRVTALLVAALVGVSCMSGCGSSGDASVQGETQQSAQTGKYEDGTYTVELTFEGGSGKSTVLPSATVVFSDGAAVATIEWSSPNYDYMMVDGEKYLPINTEGNSVFEIPVQQFDEPMNVIGDTVAMGKAHEIEYTLTFHSDTLKAAE